jgi:hypothetical protein
VASTIDGTDITGAIMPSGGGGIRGWLSAIWKALAGGAPNAARVSATGNLASNNDAATLAVDGMNTALVQLLTTSTWSAGAVVFEVSADGGSTWTAVNMAPYAGAAAVGSVSSGVANTPQLFEMACGGLTHVRARATGAITGGPVAAIVAATNGLKSLRIGAPAANPVPTVRPPLTYNETYNGALAATWKKVATTTTSTKALRAGYTSSASPYDIEWAVAPTGTYANDAAANVGLPAAGEAIQGGEDWQGGPPLGDVYLRSATLQTAIVRTGA